VSIVCVRGARRMRVGKERPTKKVIQTRKQETYTKGREGGTDIDAAISTWEDEKQGVGDSNTDAPQLHIHIWVSSVPQRANWAFFA
jgi:hypothetical protein